MVDLKRVGGTTSAIVGQFWLGGDGICRGILEEKLLIEASPGGGWRPPHKKNQNLYET